jgi:hypothetical protein
MCFKNGAVVKNKLSASSHSRRAQFARSSTTDLCAADMADTTISWRLGTQMARYTLWRRDGTYSGCSSFASIGCLDQFCARLNVPLSVLADDDREFVALTWWTRQLFIEDREFDDTGVMWLCLCVGIAAIGLILGSCAACP